MDIVSNKINFTGDIMLTKETHSDAANTYIVQTKFEYDRNGNILTLSREGKLGSSSNYDMIDELSYDYNGNQLKYVNDVDDNNSGSHHQNNGFSDNGSFLTTDEYYYDANGNMIQDLNKNMGILYNYLNLPQRILFNTSGGDNGFNIISYLYDAAGTKLSKKTKINNIENSTTDYSGSFVYEDNALRYILTPEGRVMANPDGTFEYQYFLKDHLGNTRVTFDQSGTEIQEDSYYPFGMAMNGFAYQSGSSYKNKYLYNGKELQDDFGLDWYDYGARFYDPALGRWFVPDPLAEKAQDWSPYRYAFNNPVNVIDSNGMFESTHTDENGNVVAVYDDGDNCVYEHEGNTTQAKAEVEKNHNKENTSAGGQKMGETEYWDEFMTHNSEGEVVGTNYGAKINFNVSVDKYVDGLNQTVKDKIKNDGLYNAAVWTKNQSDGLGNDGNKFDIKKTLGSSNGYLYKGKYYSGESIGNMLAGMNAASLKPSLVSANDWWQVTIKMAGKLHMKSNNLSSPPNKGKWSGENEYAGRMIFKGFNLIRKKNGWIY